MDAIICALIAGGFSLAGSVIANSRGNSKLQNDMKMELTKNQADMKIEFAKAQAVTDTKLESLTREVREHNNFAKRVPVLEEQVKRNKNDIADLSRYHKEPI